MSQHPGLVTSLLCESGFLWPGTTARYYGVNDPSPFHNTHQPQFHNGAFTPIPATCLHSLTGCRLCRRAPQLDDSTTGRLESWSICSMLMWCAWHSIARCHGFPYWFGLIREGFRTEGFGSRWDWSPRYSYPSNNYSLDAKVAGLDDLMICLGEFQESRNRWCDWFQESVMWCLDECAAGCGSWLVIGMMNGSGAGEWRLLNDESWLMKDTTGWKEVSHARAWGARWI
jgi:hypothetical protein